MSSWAFRDTHVVDEPYGLGLLTANWSDTSFTTAPGGLTLGSTALEPAPNPRSVKRLLKTVFLPFWTISNRIMIWSCLDARRAFDFSEPGSAGIMSKTLDPESSSKSRTIQNSDLDKPTSQMASTNGWSKTGKDRNFFRALSIWAELGYRSDSQGSWHPLSQPIWGVDLRFQKGSSSEIETTWPWVSWRVCLWVNDIDSIEKEVDHILTEQTSLQHMNSDRLPWKEPNRIRLVWKPITWQGLIAAISFSPPLGPGSSARSAALPTRIQGALTKSDFPQSLPRSTWDWNQKEKI